MSDALAVMKDGTLELPDHMGNQAGTGDSFLEAPNVIPCRVRRKLEYGLVELAWAGGSLLFSG